MPALFHLAFPVHDLDAAKRFYVDGLGLCAGARIARRPSPSDWPDIS